MVCHISIAAQYANEILAGGANAALQNLLWGIVCCTPNKTFIFQWLSFVTIRNRV
jgi:hypothetical protein